MGIHDVDATQLIRRVAEELKKEQVIKPLDWAMFAKTGAGRERPPMQDDWWFVRSAAILRKLFIKGPVGTSKLRNVFGNAKNRGMAPEHFYPAGGNHIRKILQQLEKAGFAKQAQKGVHKGRVISPRGQKLLESAAADIMKEQGIVLPAMPKEQKTETAEKQKKPAAKKRAPVKKKIEEVKVENAEQQTPG